MDRNISSEIIINASKETVWNILTDFSAYPAWNPFIVSIQGTLKPGSQLTNTMLNGNKRFVFKPRVLKVIPYRYFDWLGSLWFKGIFDGHHHFDIEELTPHRVRLTQSESFSGLLSGYILKKIGETTRANFIKMNEAVRALAEKTTGV